MFKLLIHSTDKNVFLQSTHCLYPHNLGFAFNISPDILYILYATIFSQEINTKYYNFMQVTTTLRHRKTKENF